MKFPARFGIRERLLFFWVVLFVVMVGSWGLNVRMIRALELGIEEQSSRMIPLIKSLTRAESLLANQHLQLEKEAPGERACEQVTLDAHFLVDRRQAIHRELDRAFLLGRGMQQALPFDNARLDVDHLVGGLAMVRQRQQRLEQLFDRLLPFFPEESTILSREDFHAMDAESDLLEREVESLLELSERMMERAFDEARRRSASTRYISIVVWCGLLVLGGALTLLAGRRMARTLVQARKMAQELARGEEPEHVKIVSRDEFGQLLAAMEQMVRSLRERKMKEERLWQAEKWNSLGCMAVGLAHEINNPLANASLVLEMMRQEAETAGAEGALARIGVLERAVGRAMAICRDLLHYSRPETASAEPVHLHDLLEIVLSLLGERLRSIQVRREFHPGLPEIPGSAAKLEQVFLNLVQNALEAMPHGGSLTLRSGVEGAFVHVEVRDSGPGIPSFLRQRVLEPFYTTRTLHGGIGMGLTIVQEIVAQHGGELLLTDAPEGGLNAVVRLPRERKRGGEAG